MYWITYVSVGSEIVLQKKLLFSNTSEKDQSDLAEFCVSPQGKDEDFSIIASIYSPFFKKYPQAGQNGGGGEGVEYEICYFYLKCS